MHSKIGSFLSFLITISSSIKIVTGKEDFFSRNAKPIKINEFDANSTAGRGLLAAATRAGNGDGADRQRNLGDGYNTGSGYLGNYAIKFQDCHSVTQWNGSNDDDDDDSAKIIHKRLVRFRLCPVSTCSSSSSTGCSTKYGDYVVDVNTFMYYYLSAQAEANSDISSYCQNECQNNYNCIDNCYKEHGYSETISNNDDDGNNGNGNFDAMNFAQCSQLQNNLYIGPYCSNDGQSIYLGLFSNDSCSQFSSCDTSCFYSAFGYELPYTSSSLVSKTCVSCTYGTVQNDSGSNYAKEQCQNIYSESGKCETKMSINYPNESACNYVNGLKHLKNGAVLANKKSKEAGLGIGFLSFSSIILALYVHYLHNKLSTAQYHLDKEMLG